MNTSPDTDLVAAWAFFDSGHLEEAIRLARQSLDKTSENNPNIAAALGWFLLSAGTLDEARALLESALRRHSDHAPLHWYLGVLHFREERRDEACQELSIAITIDPTLDEAAATLAWVLSDLHRYEDAARYAQQALSIKVQPHRVAQLGWLFLCLEEFNEAAIQLTKALSLEPQRTETRCHLATALQRMGNNDEALTVLADGLLLSPDASDLLHQQIHILLDLRRTDAARAACHRLLQQQPQEGESWYLFAKVLVQRKQRGLAVRALARAQRLASEQPDLWQKIGWLALETGHLRTARHATERVLALAPKDPGSDILAALVLEASGDLQAASTHAEQAITRAPRSAHAWRALAQIRARQDRASEAEKALQTALDLDPNDTCETYRQLGWLCFTDRRQEAAIAAFCAAIENNPQSAASWYGLAEAYRADGRSVDALRAIREALRLRDDWSDALVVHGDLLVNKGPAFWDEAVAQLAQALSLEPQRTETRCHLATALQRMGNNDEALTVLADGLLLSPDASDLLHQQIHILLDLRRTDAARAACHRLLQQQPQEGASWYLFAKVLVQRKQRGLAVRALARAQRLASEQPDLWQKIGWLALETGHLRTARHATERVLALAPKDPGSDILAALVLEASGDLQAASTHAEQAITRAPRSAHAWRALAQIRARQDRASEAEKALQTALDLDPNDTCETYRQLGWLCFTDRRQEAAIAAFCAAIENNPQSAASWYGLAEAYRADGRSVDALRAIREALRLRDDWSDRTLRGQIIHEQVYYFLNRKWSDLDGAPQPPVQHPSPTSLPATETTPTNAGAQYDYVVCSLSTKSHVPLMNTLAKSVQRHFTGRIYLLVVDSDDPGLIPDGTTLVRLSDVIEPSVWQEMVSRYNILELCCALKSYLMRFLAKTVECPIIYLDADTYLLAPLNPLLPTNPDFSVLLTPHLFTPLSGDCHAEEIGMLSVGVYNGGMVGIGLGEDGIRFLDWWLDRVTRYAYDSREQGVFTDQKWLDLVPCFFRNVHISRATGINVGHWRVCSEQDFDEVPSGQLRFCGEPVTHMHMSGFKSNRPDLLAQHIRPSVSQNSPLGRFLQRYAFEVLQNRS